MARRRPVGPVLFAGFGLTIVLWLAAGLDLAFRYQAVNREIDGMTDRFLVSEQALSDLRTSVLLGAIDWRDVLLDSGGPERAEFYVAQLHRYQQVCAASLGELERSGDPLGGSDSLAALNREVNDYWESVLPLLTLPPALRATDLRRLLGERIIPRRESVFRIVAHAQSLNRSHLQQQQRREEDVYRRARNRFLITGGAALLLSMIVGAFVSGHVSRLERRLRAELAANAKNTSQLHRLSARLVRAQEDERRLISRELHDEVGQALTAVKMQLALARRSVPDAQAGAIDEARAVTDAALLSTRQLSRLLHPPMLDDTGLAATLDWYLKRVFRADRRSRRVRAFRDGGAAGGGSRDVPVPGGPGGHDQHRPARRGHVVPRLSPAPAGERRADGGGQRRRVRARIHPRASAGRRRSAGNRGTGDGCPRHVSDRERTGPRHSYHGRAAGPEPAGPAGCRRRARGHPQRHTRHRRPPVTRILLADDHTLVRQGLRRILEEQPDWQVVAETGNGLDAVKLASDLQPDVVILDIGMPQLNGLEAARQIAKKLPAARVLILSMHADEVHITKAIEAGAVGYLVKDSADTELVRAVTATAEGKSYFSPAAAAVLLGEYRRSLARRGVTDRYELLSDREREVLQLMAEGHSSKSIAAVLGISPATVETHRSHVFEKLDLHSIAEAVLYAVRRGLIS